MALFTLALRDSLSTSIQAAPIHRSGRFGECARSDGISMRYHLLCFRRIVYNNQVFNSIDKFTTAYKSGSLKRGVKPDLINQDWSTRKRTGNARALDKRPTPHNVVFGGSRIKADKNAQYVEWMGWSLYLGFNR